MASKDARINIKTTADTSGAKKAEQAIDRATTASKKLEQQSTKGSKKVAQAAGQAAFQVQDIAVQAQMGVDATRVLAQQGSQLLSVFGPGGAIAGGVLALGAIFVDVMMESGQSVEELEEQLGQLKDSLDEVISAKVKQDFKEFNADLKEQENLTRAIITAENEAIKSKNQRADSEASIAEHTRKATIEALRYLEATGQIASAEEEIARIRQESQEAKRLAQVEKAERALAQAQKNRADVDREITDQLELEKQLTEDLLALQRERSAILPPLENIRERREAEPDIVSNEELRRLQELEAEETRLNESIEQVRKVLEGIPSTIAKFESDAINLNTAIDSAQSALETVANEVAQTGALEDAAEAAKAAVTSQKETVKELGSAFSGFEAQSKIQADAVQEINSAIQDGIITAEEQKKIGQSLQILFSTLTTSQQGTQDLIRQLIAQMQRFSQFQQQAEEGIRQNDKAIIR